MISGHVEEKLLIQHRGVGNAELKLVDHQGLIDIFLQQLDQHRGLVADAEASDLSATVEKLKGLGHLFRLHQRIGPVQKQRVQIIGVQPFQNTVNAFQNMALGKIIPEKAPVIPDAAFGLEINPLPQRGLLAHGLCENLL